MPYKILYNPSEKELNDLAAQGYRVACTTPLTQTKSQGRIETTVQVIMEKGDYFRGRSVPKVDSEYRM